VQPTEKRDRENEQQSTDDLFALLAGDGMDDEDEFGTDDDDDFDGDFSEMEDDDDFADSEEEDDDSDM